MEAAEFIDKSPAIPDEKPALGLIVISLIISVALTDLCLWHDYPRLSVGLFAIGMAGIILLNRRGMQWSRGTILLLALILGAAIESAIDLCFSNGLVLLLLLFAFAGETCYSTLRSGWSRWSEAAWTFVKTPARWFWFSLAMFREFQQSAPQLPKTNFRKLMRTAWIFLPGLLLTALFAIVLSNGNALFAKLTGDWVNALSQWIISLDITFWRIVMWGFAAVVTLPLIWPSPPPDKPRIWTKELPRVPDFTAPATARLQSGATLILLNILFCAVTTIDAVYLWIGHGAKLPAGVTPSAYVHQGVNSLIIAVIFSAALLAAVYHQSKDVSGCKPLRALGLLWIAQNLMLLAGVILRVKMYVDAYDLTLVRVNLVFFITLVGAGFLLLAIYVWQQRSLGWLFFSNLLAAFFLFYTIQFLDTAGFVARYNVNLWLTSKQTRTLDLYYLESLGRPAYQEIEKVAQSGAPQLATQAQTFLEEKSLSLRQPSKKPTWAGWQWRDTACDRWLLNSVNSR